MYKMGENMNEEKRHKASQATKWNIMNEEKWLQIKWTTKAETWTKKSDIT